MTAPECFGLSVLAGLPEVDGREGLLAAERGAWRIEPPSEYSHPLFPTFRAGAAPQRIRPRRRDKPGLLLGVYADALVLGGGVVVDSATGSIVADSISGLSGPEPPSAERMQRPLADVKLRLEGGAIRPLAPLPAAGAEIRAPVLHFTYRSDHNHTHFMFEVLPQLHYWLLLPAPRPRLLVSAHVARRMASLLALYGAGPEDLLVAPRADDPPLRIRRLYLGVPPALAHASVLRSLRAGGDALGPAPEPRRRLYVMRQGWLAWQRKLLNEPQVLAELAGRGFEPVVMEGLSPPQQVALFRQAECVAGVYGGGLFNSLFCAPGTRLLSLTSPDYHRSMLDGMPESERLRGATVVGESFSSTVDRNNSPFVVDMVALRAACAALAL